MRLATDGNQDYRVRWMRRIMEQTGENTKSGAIDFSLEFTNRMLADLEQAAEHPDMTPELANILSNHKATIEIEKTAELQLNN